METCFERLQREHPGMIDARRSDRTERCPDHLGYASVPEWCVKNSPHRLSATERAAVCRRCWDRPVEEVKADGD